LTPKQDREMNTTLRNRIVRKARKTVISRDKSLIDAQAVGAVEDTSTEEASEEKKSTQVEVNEFGPVMKATFSIKIKNEGDDAKDRPFLVNNPKEPFTYQSFTRLIPALAYHGGFKVSEFPEANADALEKAFDFGDNKELQEKADEAIDSLLKILNAKSKSDAKNSAYQSIVNKNAPLEGEKRQTAIARTINNFVKLAGITPEVAIEILKSRNAVDADYTVQDYRETKLRKTKDESSEDDE
jgi:hypothetical protein